MKKNKMAIQQRLSEEGIIFTVYTGNKHMGNTWGWLDGKATVQPHVSLPCCVPNQQPNYPFCWLILVSSLRGWSSHKGHITKVIIVVRVMVWVVRPHSRCLWIFYLGTGRIFSRHRCGRSASHSGCQAKTLSPAPYYALTEPVRPNFSGKFRQIRLKFLWTCS